jgi:competence protein ComEA
MVAARAAGGPFGGLDGLARVPGLGPATREALRPYATFSGRPARTAGAARAPADVPVRVNAATAEELDGLPGVGPRLAQEIVADRARNGPFRDARDLLRVRGIGPTLLARWKGRILVP